MTCLHFKKSIFGSLNLFTKQEILMFFTCIPNWKIKKSKNMFFNLESKYYSPDHIKTNENQLII